MRSSGKSVASLLAAAALGMMAAQPAPTNEPGAREARDARQAQQGEKSTPARGGLLEHMFGGISSGRSYRDGWRYQPKKPWGGSVKRHARAMAKKRRR